MVVASDVVEPEADEALSATTTATASGRSPPLVVQLDGYKPAKDEPIKVDNEIPRPPRSVAQGCLEFGPLNSNKAERFLAIRSSLAARVAPLLLLNPAPSLDLWDSARTRRSTLNSSLESPSRLSLL